MRVRCGWILLLSCAGCASFSNEPALTAVPWENHGIARSHLHDKNQRSSGFSAQGRVVLQLPEGPVQFDCAIAVMPPDRLRLRAWKVGRPMLDWLVTGDQWWLWTGGGMEALGTMFRHMAKWAPAQTLPPDRFMTAKIWDIGGASFLMCQTLDGGMTLEEWIDRSTLTVRCRQWSLPFAPPLTLTFEKFQQIGPVIWAQQWQCDFGPADIRILWDDVESGSPPDAAWKPVSGAERLR